MNDTLDVLMKIAALREQFPNNIAIQSFDASYFKTLEPSLQNRLLNCIRSGVETPQSEMGCYANLWSDYDDLQPFFSQVVEHYHGVDPHASHASNWDLSETGEKPESPSLDVSRLALPAPSVRIRVARNLANLPLPAAMTRKDRIQLETKALSVLKHLTTESGLAGDYYSLTPQHPNQIDEARYKKLVDQHLMFKSMEHDPYLVTAGIASDWPAGRGCYISKDQGFIVWIGEEDHLRIMVMAQTTKIGDVFDRLKSALTVLEQTGLQFATSKRFGTVTSCPTNLGTGMRASVHMQLPNLTSRHTEKELKTLAGQWGLRIRGMGGEHTAYGKDGTVDVSPGARFGITEADIVKTLYNGIRELKGLEDKAAV